MSDLSSRHPSVLITIHGMGRFSWSMSHFGPLARKRGYIPLNLSYRTREGSLMEIAERLSHELELRFPSGEHYLSFIGHSLGGLMIRALDTLLDERFHLGHAVSLGSPHSGCSFGRVLGEYGFFHWRFGKVFSDLYSHTLPPHPHRVRIGSLAGVLHNHLPVVPWFTSPNDGLVSVDETLFPGASDHVVVRGLHGILMYQPSVVAQSFHFLEHGTFEKT